MSEIGIDSPDLSAFMARLRNESARLDIYERLVTVRREISGRIVLTTSFGIEDQAIAHVIFTNDLEIDVVTLDTGRLFPETLAVWGETEHRYGRQIRAFAPDRESIENLIARDGVNGFRASLEARRACCVLRKVEPLGRALTGAAAWVTGLRADQSAERGQTSFASFDPQHRVIKVSPLFDWSRARVAVFVHDHCIPYNPLHDRGFLSIGCAPCTRTVGPGEAERAGRWWWEQEEKRECGLHQSHPARRAALAYSCAAPRGSTPWTK